MLALRYDSSAAILYAISDCFLILGDYQLSVEYGHQALKKNPSFLPCYELLCKGYLYLNDIKNATITLENAVKMSENEDLLYFLGNLYEYQKSELAKDTYQKLINKYNNISAVEQLVNIERENSNYEKSGNILHRAWKDQPNNFKLTMELINNWFIENKIDSIVENIDNFDISFNVDDLETMYNYIIVRLDTNTIGYNEIIRKIDDRFNFSQILIYSAGNYAIKNNDTNTAKIYFDKIVSTSDVLPEIVLKYINKYYENGYSNLAKETLNKCLIKFPTNWEYPYWRGILEESEKNYDSCIKYLTIAQSIEYNINFETIKKNLDEEVTDIQKMSLISSASTMLIDKLLANLYFQLKNYILSDSLYEKIIIENPDPMTYNNYAYSLSIRGVLLDKALELSKKSLEYNSSSPEYLDTYGWIHYKLGDYYKALNYIEKSLSFDNKNYEVYLHLADIYIVLEENISALKIIENAIEIAPNNFDLLEKKIMIEKKISQEKN